MSEPEIKTLPQLFQWMTENYGRQQHQHQWAILEVHPYGNEIIHPRVALQPKTLVLLKCHCGMPMSLLLEGKWDMTQLQMEIGAQHATQREKGSASGPERDEGATGEYPPTE